MNVRVENGKVWIGQTAIYIDLNDWWIGYYRGPSHHYFCPLPTVVIRRPRKDPTK